MSADGQIRGTWVSR